MTKKILILLPLFILVLSAKELEIYQDQAIYKVKQNGKYIGFFKGGNVSCNSEDVEIISSFKCSEENHICKLYNKIDTTSFNIDEALENIKTIEAFVSSKSSSIIDANKILESAKVIAKEKSSLNKKLLNLKKELSLLNSQFSKITTSKEPQYLKEPCSGELKITIPSKYINFSPIYEANILDNKQVEVTQKVAINNRSGIDIDAKELKLYYRPLREYIYPINFRPWIVSELKPMPRVMYKSAKAKVASDGFGFGSEASGMGGDIAPVEPVGIYNDAREYIVKNLKLPSSAQSKKVNILEYKSDISCGLRVYPKSDLRVFKICFFKPKYQIDKNSWIIKENGKLINKKGIGRYKDGNYLLYVNSDRDIVVKRKKIVNKERKSGIFGGSKKVVDGYKITIINKSNKSKTLKVIDAIPTSTTDKIEVKLLSIKPKIDYKLLKNGKIEIELNLKPNEHKSIEVMFELSYDKDLKVSY